MSTEYGTSGLDALEEVSLSAGVHHPSGHLADVSFPLGLRIPWLHRSYHALFCIRLHGIETRIRHVLCG